MDGFPVKRSCFLLFFAACFLFAGRAPAQSGPFFDTFGYAWHTRPGAILPKSTAVLGATSPNGAWDKVIWAKGKRWPTVDYLAENADTDLSGGGSRLVLSVTPPPAQGKPAGGAEVIHKIPRGFGSYRARLKVSPGTWNGNIYSPGVCNGFYVISDQVEIDMEFLSIQQARPAGTGQLEIVIHDYTFIKGNRLSYHKAIPIPWFDPSKDFHVYGFDWYPGYVNFYVDGRMVHQVKSGVKGWINVSPWWGPITLPGAGNVHPGTLRLNNWTDLLGWCGPPPARKMDFVVDWVSFSPLYFLQSGNEISLASGGTVNLDLLGGGGRRGMGYVLLASLHGLDKGFALGSLVLPLEFDLQTGPLFLSLANTPVFTGFLGLLDSQGGAKSAFQVPSGLPSGLGGTRFRFCPLLFDPATGALGPWGNPCAVTLK